MLESYRINKKIASVDKYSKQSNLSGYHKQIAGAPINDHIETFIDWDDPYANFRFWTIIDFLRNFKLTK